MTLTRPDAPALVTWEQFINTQVAKKRRSKTSINPKTKRVTVEGIHRLYNGRTRSGKTTLCRIMTRMEKTCLVFGTEPNDPSLDDYIYKEGFIRIEQWPPTKDQLKVRGPYDQVKLLLWPKMTAYGDLKRNRPHFQNALRDVQAEGSWSVVIDEGFQVCRRGGLDLGEEVSEISFGGAGNGISLSLIIQRPSGIPVITHEQSHELYQFKSGNINDIRSLASYAGKSPREFADALRTLNEGKLHGHQFLHAPMTDGEPWEVSEVPRNWAT
jgi:hypothetical protein